MEDIIISERVMYLIYQAMMPMGILLLIIIWKYRDSNIKDGSIAFLKTGSMLAVALTCQTLLYRYSEVLYELGLMSITSYLAMVLTVILTIKVGISTLCRQDSVNFGRTFIEASCSLWISSWLVRDPDTIGNLLTVQSWSYFMPAMSLVYTLQVVIYFIILHKSVGWALSKLMNENSIAEYNYNSKVFSWLIAIIAISIPIYFIDPSLLPDYSYFLLFDIIDIYTYYIPASLHML